jgi:hypothetical protein
VDAGRLGLSELSYPPQAIAHGLVSYRRNAARRTNPVLTDQISELHALGTFHYPPW